MPTTSPKVTRLPRASKTFGAVMGQLEWLLYGDDLGGPAKAADSESQRSAVAQRTIELCGSRVQEELPDGR